MGVKIKKKKGEKKVEVTWGKKPYMTYRGKDYTRREWKEYQKTKPGSEDTPPYFKGDKYKQKVHKLTSKAIDIQDRRASKMEDKGMDLDEAEKKVQEKNIRYNLLRKRLNRKYKKKGQDWRVTKKGERIGS